MTDAEERKREEAVHRVYQYLLSLAAKKEAAKRKRDQDGETPPEDTGRSS